MKIKRKKCSLDFTFLLLSGLIYDNPKEIGLQNKKAVVMNQEYMADDRTIIQAMRKDIGSGFRLLVKCYGGPLYWHIRRMVVGHDDANDVLQNTLMKAWKGLDLLGCSAISANMTGATRSRRGYTASPPARLYGISAEGKGRRCSRSTT